MTHGGPGCDPRARLLHLLRDLASRGSLVMVALHQLNEAVKRAIGRCCWQVGVWLPRARQRKSSRRSCASVYGVEMVPAAQFGFRVRPRKTRRHERATLGNACALAAAIALTIQFGRATAGNLAQLISRGRASLIDSTGHSLPARHYARIVSTNL